MRAFDISGVGLLLLLVPYYGWLLGRFAGRRDWRIAGVLALGLVLVTVLQVAVLAGQCIIEGQTSAVGNSFAFLLQRRGYEALVNPEFPVFVFILGTFVTMLGWSATPVKKDTETVVA
jgi:hypothetical protein